jgi:hypothetical protein
MYEEFLFLQEDFFILLLYSTLLDLPYILLCQKMLEVNPELLQLWHFKSGTQTTQLGISSTGDEMNFFCELLRSLT